MISLTLIPKEQQQPHLRRRLQAQLHLREPQQHLPSDPREHLRPLLGQQVPRVLVRELAADCEHLFEFGARETVRGGEEGAAGRGDGPQQREEEAEQRLLQAVQLRVDQERDEERCVREIALRVRRGVSCSRTL